MQSLRRQIKRGHAVMAYNAISKNVETVQKRGTEKKIWNNAVRNRMGISENEYVSMVTLPLAHAQVIKTKSRRVANAPKQYRKQSKAK